MYAASGIKGIECDAGTTGNGTIRVIRLQQALRSETLRRRIIAIRCASLLLSTSRHVILLAARWWLTRLTLQVRFVPI
jgi:hypothetical protein